MINLSERTIECLDLYSVSVSNSGHMIQEDLKKICNAPKILPVVGMQGMGKSTLLDAVLKKQILPAEADETTCVPVEIKYGDTEYAIIHHGDLAHKINEISSETLAEYVDNKFNPGNKKGISYIELFCPEQILKNGLTLVDLPGVGSLTKVNEETTRRYLNNIVAAIFVISLVPPIRRQDATFIKLFWAQFREAIFIQNEWGETEEEIEGGTEHNIAILHKIGESLKCPFNASHVITVNAHDALTGALQKNEKLRKTSNIDALEAKIRELAEAWEQRLHVSLRHRLRTVIGAAIAEATRKLRALKQSEEERERDNALKLEEFRSSTLKLKIKTNDLVIKFTSKIIDLNRWVENEAKKLSQTLRSQIYAVIDKGTIDGHYLSSSFNNIRAVELEKFTDALLLRLNELINEIEEGVQGLKDILVANNWSMVCQEFYSEEEIKYEKAINAAFHVGGVVGAWWGAGALAALIASNPAGWLIGAVGMGIGAIASLLGFGISEAIQDGRKREAKKAVDKPIRDLQKELIENCKRNFELLRDRLVGDLNSLVAARELEESELRARLLQPVSKEETSRLEEDIEYLRQVEKHV